MRRMVNEVVDLIRSAALSSFLNRGLTIDRFRFPTFLGLELRVGLDIPDEVAEHSMIKSPLSLAVETTFLAHVRYFHADPSACLEQRLLG
jgi:hypothetical protein